MTTLPNKPVYVRVQCSSSAIETIKVANLGDDFERLDVATTLTLNPVTQTWDLRGKDDSEAGQLGWSLFQALNDGQVTFWEVENFYDPIPF